MGAEPGLTCHRLPPYVVLMASVIQTQKGPRPQQMLMATWPSVGPELSCGEYALDPMAAKARLDGRASKSTATVVNASGAG